MPSLALYPVGQPPSSLSEHISLTTDIEKRFDAVGVFDASTADFYKHLAHARKLHLPIINFTSADLPRQETSITNLQETLRPILTRQRELGDIADSPDYLHLAVLALAHTRQSEIAPVYSANMPECVTYPLLTGIDEPLRILSELESLGTLRPAALFDRLHVCSRCRSSRLNVREECDACRSPALRPTSLIHHYPCGYQDVDGQFRSNTTETLQCPKCRKTLRHYGVDYDRSVALQICQACEQHVFDPSVGFVCLDCSSHYDGEQVNTRDWWQYRVAPDGVSALRQGQLPLSGLSAALDQIAVAYPRRVFDVVLRQHHAVAERYDRPLSLVRIRIGNVEELRRAHGQAGLSKIMSLVAETISGEVRQSDAVTAQDDVAFILLTETRPTDAQTVADRMQARLTQTLDPAVLFEISVADRDSFDPSDLQNA